MTQYFTDTKKMIQEKLTWVCTDTRPIIYLQNAFKLFYCDWSTAFTDTKKWTVETWVNTDPRPIIYRYKERKCRFFIADILLTQGPRPVHVQKWRRKLLSILGLYVEVYSPVIKPKTLNLIKHNLIMPNKSSTTNEAQLN